MAENKKVMVITGAGIGMGRATAVLFAQNGYTVVGSDNGKMRDELLNGEIFDTMQKPVCLLKDGGLTTIP